VIFKVPLYLQRASTPVISEIEIPGNIFSHSPAFFRLEYTPAPCTTPCRIIQVDNMPGRETYGIKQNSDGSVTLEYTPKGKGTHELQLSHNDKACDGTPFLCHVDAVGSGFVTAYGDGLQKGASGEEASFVVAGGGSKLDISVDGPSKADIKDKSEKDGLTHVTYVPFSPGEYDVTIKAGGKHIHGSPFSAKISGEGRKKSQLVLSGTSDVTLGGPADLTGLVGKIKTPGGQSEPVLLKKMKDGTLGLASFAPKVKGTYVVDAVQDGKAVSGSPFNINVTDVQVACAGKVKVSGQEKMEAGKWNEMTVDLTNAGYGNLSLSLEGGHRADVETESFDGKVYKIKVKPHEPGIYLNNIRFADEHITGSPFLLNVGGEPSGRVRAVAVKDVKAAARCGKGSQCQFALKVPGADPLEMEASLTTPNGKLELCEIRDSPGHIYTIKFEPQDEGVHTVSLKHRGLHIAGSPFQYTVGDPPNSGAYKVEIGGPGLERAEINKPNDFNIYTREAGGGKLEVSVEGPDKATIEVDDKGQGYTMVKWSAAKDGEYGVHVKFDGEHVPDSPAVVHVLPSCEGADLVQIIGLRDRGLELGKHVSFNIDKNGAKGTISAHLDTPSGNEQDIFLQELDKQLSAVRFVPAENGVHYVHIKLNGANINGSPFPMLIGKLGADAALVMASGDGLTKGKCGQASKFKVATTNAGNGTLKVEIQGPSKTAIQCVEVDDGYEFAYTPMSPGSYLITIKYCNVTIAGCPSKAVISGEGSSTGVGKASDVIDMSSLAVETVEKVPGKEKKKKFVGDASKVVVKGTGFKKAFINRPATFTIEVTGAGNGLLTAGMISATGNPVEEFGIKKTRPTVHTVTFKSKEKGEHQLIIRWGHDDIPGSPFLIPIA